MKDKDIVIFVINIILIISLIFIISNIFFSSNITSKFVLDLENYSENKYNYTNFCKVLDKTNNLEFNLSLDQCCSSLNTCELSKLNDHYSCNNEYFQYNLDLNAYKICKQKLEIND